VFEAVAASGLVAPYFPEPPQGFVRVQENPQVEQLAHSRGDERVQALEEDDAVRLQGLVLGELAERVIIVLPLDREAAQELLDVLRRPRR